MFAVMIVICVVILLLLILVAGVVPKHSAMSMFELKRRNAEGNREASQMLRREELLGGVLALQRVISSLLLVIFVLLSVVTFGWLLGIVVSAMVALEYSALARLGIFSRQSQKLYAKIEAPILKFIGKYPKLIAFIQTALPPSLEDNHIDSKEELAHIVAGASPILSKDERSRIINGLKFDTREVKEIMTPRGMIDSISKKEILGPLVLDDLHKTGHSRFPVTDGDIDHVVGMLFIQDLLVIDGGKRTGSVEKAMEPRVFYIHEEQSLAHALAAFIRTRHHLFIVINEFRETVGVVSLEDVMEALLGHKIVDEFDTHEDLRQVAARNPRGNNHPEKREDV